MLYKSIYLELRKTASGDYFAYHSLFGNLSKIDVELFTFLEEYNNYEDAQTLSDIIGEKVINSLIDNHFFVYQLEEEIIILEDLIKTRHTNIQKGALMSGLQISSSNACNLGCTYCFADSSDKRSAVRTNIKKKNIDFETAKDGIEKLLKFNDGKRIAVKFLGREPLINWKVIERILENFTNSNVDWSITTNGTVFTEKNHTITN